MAKKSKISVLTEEQKQILLKQRFDYDSYFNPIQDEDDNWVISEDEITRCNLEDKKFIKQLPQKDHKPKPNKPI